MRAEISGAGPSAVGGSAGGWVTGTNTGVGLGTGAGTGAAAPEAAGAAWDTPAPGDGGLGWRARIHWASAGMPVAAPAGGTRADDPAAGARTGAPPGV